MAIAEGHPQFPLPILHQLFDCSEAQSEISALAMVSLYADRAPQAVVFHDAAQPNAGSGFLACVTRALGTRFPGVELYAQDLRADPARYSQVSAHHDINLGARVAATLPSWRLAASLGIAPADLETVGREARSAYRDFVPSLPNPAAIRSPAVGVSVVAAHAPERRVSGYLAFSASRRAGLLLHDVDPGDSRAVNGYLAVVVGGDEQVAALTLAERSLKDTDDQFCRVSPCHGNELVLPVRSTASIRRPEVAAALGLLPAQLARLVGAAADIRCWRSPFAGARTLGVSPPASPLAPWSDRGVAG